MGWILGSIGWIGVAAAIGIVLLGVGISKNIKIIAVALALGVVFVWGCSGYAKAKLEEEKVEKLNTEITELNKKIGKLNLDLANAAAAAEACSASVEALGKQANMREEEAKEARALAAKERKAKEDLAAYILNKKPSTPGDDCKSSRDLVDDWLSSQGESK